MGSMILCAVGIGALIVSIALYIINRRQCQKVMEHLTEMIDAAVQGNFNDQHFDESMLSLVEAKLAHYLAASEVSAQNLQEEKDKIKTLIADISHQTKTPIANILLYTEILGEKNLPEDCVDCVKQLKQQSEKLNFLIQSLVKTSRLEAGILEIHPVEQEVVPVINEVIEEIKMKAQVAEITIESSWDKECQAKFDRKWTTEAIYNIVDNAVKYTPAGGLVSICIEPMDLFVRIDVTDTGMGIKEEEHAQIFKRFYRSMDVSDKEGVGIGLFLAREIISKEDGYIKVSSKYGQGSTFSIYLAK